MSSNHYRIKGQTRDTAPSFLGAVCVDTKPSDWTNAAGDHEDVFASATVLWSRRDGMTWKPHETRTVQTIGGLWDIIDRWAGLARRPYVVAPVASDTLTLCRWWQRVESGELVVWRQKGQHDGGQDAPEKKPECKPLPLVIHGRPDIIGYRLGGTSFRWVSAHNWVDLSIHEMASAVGMRPPDNIDPLARLDCPRYPSWWVSLVVLRHTQKLISWWLRNQCGRWADSPGSAAWSSFLRRLPAGVLIRHDDGPTRKLESSACFGGRAAVWFFGDIGVRSSPADFPSQPPEAGRGLPLREPVSRWDVRSMYPTLLRDEEYPTRLDRLHGPMSVQRLGYLLESYLLVASVRVRTKRTELPCRLRGRVAYPSGEYDTTLTTPEVRDALCRGELVRVWAVATYHRGRPFRPWAEWVLGLRSDMRTAGDRAGELMVKTLANSLGGRLAKRSQRWEADPHVIPRRLWGEWWELDGKSPDGTVYRSLAGLVQRLETDDLRPGLLAACFAHLTAYGRIKMAKIRERLGKRGCLWQDTDGIIVPDRYVERLMSTGEVHPDEPGKLRHEGTYTLGRFFTPKHYWLDGRWVLAGIHDGFEMDDGMISTEVLTINPARQGMEPVNAGLIRAVRHCDLSELDPGVTIGSDGWAVAPTVGKLITPTPEPGAVPDLFSGHWE